MNDFLETNDIKRFLSLLDKSERIVLTCHVHPDGDAIGSTLGLMHLFRDLGKHATVVVPDTPPRSLRFLPDFNEIAVYTRHDPYCSRLIEESDLIICCDFNTSSRQDHLAPLINSAKSIKILIDHHEEPDMNCELQFSYPEMSSTCELVFRIIAACGFYSDLNHNSATCLLTGLITDTQNFTVNCRNNDIYEILAKLMDKGADKRKIIEECIKACSYWSLKLKSHALSDKLEIFPSHRCGLITINKDELAEYKYEKGDTEGLVNEPLNIRGMVYSVFMREDSDCIKVSCRSKYEFPVSQICKDLFNGGGHRMAAGGEYYGSLEECRNLFINHIKDYDSFIPKKLEKLEIN